MNLGDYVHLRMHGHNGVDSRTIGRIVAVETYENFQSADRYFWVRWYSSGGRPEDCPMKMEAIELEPVEMPNEAKD